MIAELFYPRELKRLIKDLNAEGALNESALKKLNAFFYFYFVPLSIAAFGFVIFEGMIFVSIVSFILSTVYAAYHLRFMFYHDVLPYLEGEIIMGEVVEKHNSGLQGIYSVLYRFQCQGELKKRKLTCDNNVEWENTRKGPIQIFVLSKKRHLHAPYLPDKFKKLCLDTRRIQEITNSIGG